MPTEAINALIQACIIGLVLGVGVMSFVRLRKTRIDGLLWPAAFGAGALAAYLRILEGDLPHLPPREATEAFILFVVPVAVLIDAIDGMITLRKALRWSMWLLAIIATPGLLFFNRIADVLEGASSWTPAEAVTHLGCMVVGLMVATFTLGAAFGSTAHAGPDANAAAGSDLPPKRAFDIARHLPAALAPVAALAGVTLLSSGSFRLGALALAAVSAPLAGAYLALATGCPQISKKMSPLIFILPLGATIIMGYELAGLSLQNTALLALATIAPALVGILKVRNVLRQPWQAFAVMVLLGLIPASIAAVPAALAAARAASSNDGY